MTKHILCALDLTHLETEGALLKKAADLAGFYGATLSVVTVLAGLWDVDCRQLFQRRHHESRSRGRKHAAS